MKRTAVLLAIVGTIAGLTASASGCGNGIGEGGEPELVVETPQIELTHRDMEPNGADQPQPAEAIGEELTIRNNGTDDMEITSIEWVEKPTRVEAIHTGDDDADSCANDEDCPDGLCLTNQCRDIGFGDPDPVAPESEFSQRLAVAADNEEPINCPEPPDDPDIPSDYCGEIKIETSAHNDDDHVEDGETTIYLVTDGSSGMMALSETVLDYTYATWGVAQEVEFEVINEADTELQIDRMDIDTNASWFNVTPVDSELDGVSGLVVDGRDSERISIEMIPPDREDVEDSEEDNEIEFNATVTFETSSITTEPGMTLRVTSGPGDVPVMDVQPERLSFVEDDTQTVSVYNHGVATLSVRGMTIRDYDADSTRAEDNYSVVYHDEDGDSRDMLQPDVASVPVTGAQPADEQDEETDEIIMEPGVEHFEVTLDNPEADDTLGTLRINHDDDYAESPWELTLLGTADDVAIGIIGPEQVNFLADGGQQTRHLVLRNEGTEQLEIEQVQLDAGSNTDVDDYTITTADDQPLEGQIVEAGSIRELELTYSGEPDNPEMAQDLEVTIASSDLAPESVPRVRVDTRPVSESDMDIELAPAFADYAEVGEQTSFTVIDDGDVGRLDQASWYVLQRPADSQADIEGVGPQVNFLPDASGTYRVAVIVDDGEGHEAQDIVEFDAQ